MFDDVIGNDLKMDPALHEPLPNGQWIRTVHEKTKNANIFVYRHRVHGNFVVCEWIHKPPVYGQGLATCTELFTMSGPPDHGPPDLPDMGWVVNRCRPIWDYFDGHREQIAADEYERVRKEQEGTEARKELVKDLRRRGMDEAAGHMQHGLATHASPLEGGPMMEELAAELIEAATGRTISTGGKERKPRHKF